MVMKEQGRGIIAKVSRELDFPIDALCDIPSIRVTGRGSALAENCRGILFYSSQRLVLDMGAYSVGIVGESLTLRALSQQQMMIEGSIQLVDFEDKEQGDDT